MKSDWSRGHHHEHGIIWTRVAGFCYLYNKGMFRTKENYYVISTSLTGGSNPLDRLNVSFDTKKEAIIYAKKFMELNPKWGEDKGYHYVCMCCGKTVSSVNEDGECGRC